MKKQKYEQPLVTSHDELVDITACFGSGKGKDTREGKTKSEKQKPEKQKFEKQKSEKQSKEVY
jgi:hypothetical protein